MSATVIRNEQQKNIDVEAKELINRCCILQPNSPGLIALDHITDFQASAPDHRGCKLWRYRDDCLVGIRDLRMTEDITTSASLENTLSLEFILSGGSAVELSGQHFANHDMPLAYLSSHCGNGRQTRFHKAGKKFRGLGLWFSLQLLSNDFGLDYRLLPERVQSMFLLEQQSTVILPLTMKIRSILAEILELFFSGLLAERFLRAKSHRTAVPYCSMFAYSGPKI